MIHTRFPALSLLALTLFSPALFAFAPGEDEPLQLNSKWLEDFEYRSLGPASMGGRCVAIAVSQQDSNTYWIATASGGLLKTTNAGTTYTHQFDHEGSVSIGHVAVAPSDDQILWVGTGEANPRNSVSYGDGVYKSEDGGATWKRKGLKDTFQTGRIAIHPEDPDVVYVGSLGRLFGHNEERGLFKTSDGGKNWDKVLYIDDKTGVIDVDMHPTEPDTLIVATYERERDGFDTNAPMKTWGPGSGIYRTKDAGKTWMKLTQGLPNVELGRIGIDYSRQNPDVIFAVIESERIGRLPEDAAFMGMSGEDADVGARITRVTKEGPAEAAGFEEDDIVLSLDGERILGYDDLLLAIRTRKGGDKATIEVLRKRELVEVEIEFDVYDADSRGLRPFASFLGGQRENMQDSQGPDGHQTGGIYKSTDGGDTWAKINSLNPRPMYYSQIRVDPNDEQRLYVLGTSFWTSEDGGETFEGKRFGEGVHVDNHELWIDPANSKHLILGNDGGIYVTHDRTENWDHHNHMAIGQFYHVTASQGELYNVYGGLQDNGSWGGPNRTRSRHGSVNSDWFNIGGGDGFVCRVDPNDKDVVFSESQGGAIGWRNLRTGEGGGARPGSASRWNWETPFLLSHHNSRVFYSAGARVFRSLNRGRSMVAISPEITLTDRGSASALAESPHDPDLLWVGTDDGALWVTRDGGDNWTDLRRPVPADGMLDPAQRRESLLVELIDSLDTDGDGTITKGEVPESLAATFERADIDGDETLGESEIALATGVPLELPGDVLDGTWEVAVAGDAVPPTGSEFKLVFATRGEEDVRSGKLDSKKSKGKLRAFEFDEETGAIAFTFKSEEALIAFSGTLAGEVLSGQLKIEEGDFSADYEATRESKKKNAPKKPKLDDPSYAEVMPEPMWITGLEASRHKKGRIYLAVDGHRSDDDMPHAFVSEDEGLSWRTLTDDLPRGNVRCIREDRVNENLLYLGTEFNGWISIDRGLSWTQLKGMPTVAIHEFAQSPTTGDIVIGTHGRSMWAFDATPLRQFTADNVNADAHLYAPTKMIRWRSIPTRASSGTRRFTGTNPSSDATIWYSIGERAKSVQLSVLGAGGETLYSFDELSKKTGLHKLEWHMRAQSPESKDDGNRRRRRGGRGVPNGSYTVQLVVDGRTQTQTLEIAGDPDFPDYKPRGLEEELEEEDEEEPEHRIEEYAGDR